MMIKARIFQLFLFPLVLQFAGCLAVGKLTSAFCSSSGAQPVADGQWLEDCAGDVEYDFADIVRAKSEVNPDGVFVTIEVREIPTVFLVNRVAVEDNDLEYYWGAYFDIGNDSQEVGDIELAVARWKFPGDSPIRRPIAEFVQVDAWKTGIDENVSTLCKPGATFQGNQIRIIAFRDNCEGLSQITAATRVSYSTHYDTGEPEAYYDDLPDGRDD